MSEIAKLKIANIIASQIDNKINDKNKRAPRIVRGVQAAPERLPGAVIAARLPPGAVSVTLWRPIMRNGWYKTVKKDFKKNYIIYLLLLPIIVWYIVFCYAPMWGISVSFVDYKPAKGLLGSQFVGWRYFRSFFQDPTAVRTIWNTFSLNLWGLIFGFPAPIVFALMLNEVRFERAKRVMQTISYMPYFISIVVVCGMIHVFSGTDGLFNIIISLLGDEKRPLLQNSGLSRPIYTFSGIWQGAGFGSIIYFAAISGIDPALYESAVIDGANRIRQIWHISIPCIIPTITIMFIFAIGGMLGSSFEKVILLYNPLTIDKADVIASLVYRRGIRENNISFATAVGTMNSAVNFLFLFVANKIAQKAGETSVW
jgi:putative aldouronate transport system permease protein